MGLTQSTRDGKSVYSDSPGTDLCWELRCERASKTEADSQKGFKMHIELNLILRSWNPSRRWCYGMVFGGALLGCHIGVFAAPGEIFLEVFGADWPEVSAPAVRFPHAFMCLEYHLSSGIKEDCFGFYSAFESARKVEFTNGDCLTSSNGTNWAECRGGFKFIRQGNPCDFIRLFDSTRNLSWEIPVRGGVSKITWPQHPRSEYWVVKGVALSYDPTGLISGPGIIKNEICERPERFTSIAATFKKKLSDAQRTVILNQVAAWNDHKYKFTTQNCIDFVDSIASKLALKTPARSAVQGGGDYVKALVSLNP